MTQVFSTIVPTIDIHEEHADVKLTSPLDFTTQQFVSSNASQNQAQWTINVPSNRHFMDRCIWKQIPVVINLAGTTTGTAILQAQLFALRAYPVAAISATDAFTINNFTKTIQTSDLIPYLAHYWKPSKQSLYPNYLDNYSNYSDGSVTTPVLSINNPLGSYGNSFPGVAAPRGAFPMVVVSNTSTAAQITATIYEPTWVPLCMMESMAGVGFTNVNNMTLTTTYNVSNLARILSMALGLATISSVSVTLQTPTLLCRFLTPPESYVPRPISYGYTDLTYTPTQYSSALTSGSSTTLTSNVIQCPVTPSWIQVYVREANQNLTFTSADWAANITGVTIQYNNKSGLLSQATEADLYTFSKDCGLRDEWDQYHGSVNNGLATQVGTSGSFLRLRFGQHITLSPDDFPGKQGVKSNLIVTVNVTNRSSITIANPVLYVVVGTPARLDITPGGAQTIETLGITGQEGQYMNFHHVTKHYGGSFKSFFTNIWNGIKKVAGPIHDFVKKNQLISKALAMIPHPYGKAAAVAANTLGYGERDGEGGMYYENSMGGARRGRKPRKYAHGDGDGDGDGEGEGIRTRSQLLNAIREL